MTSILRRARKRLREVFEHGSAGRDAEAVAELNSLLEAYPMQPRISGHDTADWHMHVTGRGASVSAEYLAGAVWGLAVWLCEHGSARFGVCADERCGNVYLDTSSNCCRRFCSERCATRSHVAAHRARKKPRRAACGARPQRVQVRSVASWLPSCRYRTSRPCRTRSVSWRVHQIDQRCGRTPRSSPVAHGSNWRR